MVKEERFTVTSLKWSGASDGWLQQNLVFRGGGRHGQVLFVDGGVTQEQVHSHVPYPYALCRQSLAFAVAHDVDVN
jgi:hypothetical protein